MTPLESFIILIEENIKDTSDVKKGYEIYYSKEIPSTSVRKYINVIFYTFIKKDNINGIILYSIIMFYRIKKCGIIISLRNIHRIILVSVLLATKLYDDENISNKTWAEMCGVTNTNINALEICTTKMLNYNLFINQEQLNFAAKVL